MEPGPVGSEMVLGVTPLLSAAWQTIAVKTTSMSGKRIATMFLNTGDFACKDVGLNMALFTGNLGLKCVLQTPYFILLNFEFDLLLHPTFV